jgi:hypothetical protein
LNPCQWLDEDGVPCSNRARRKYCGVHQTAAAARRQREYRERQQNPGKRTGAPLYVPENNTRAAYQEKLKAEGLELTQSGRVIPRQHDVPPKPPRAPEPEVQDGRVSKRSIYDQAPRSSAPAAVRRDAVRFAAWQAQEQGLVQQDEGLDWERISEIGEDEYLRERHRMQNERPGEYTFYFETPWRKGPPGYRGYLDPMEPDCIDGSFLRRS